MYLPPVRLPAKPKGVITAVYLRCVPIATVENVTYKNIRLSLGYSNSAKYLPFGAYDSFKTGLVPVFNKSFYSFTGVTVKGAWIKFNASINWTYDPTQNTVVDIQHGIESQQNFGGFGFMTTPVGAYRMIGGRKDSMRTPHFPAGKYMDLGFDITPVGIEGTHILTSLGVFPNPSTDGQFMVSANMREAAQQAAIRIFNSVGQLVYQASYNKPGSSLFEAIDFSEKPAGIYFMKLVVDGEVSTRRITLQH